MTPATMTSDRPPPETSAGDAFDWQGGSPIAFVTLWTTGEDPGLDHLLRVLALRQGEGSGDWETLDVSCELDESIDVAELEDRFGPRASAGEVELDAAWQRLATFCEGHAVISAERETFERWAAHLSRGFDDVPPGIGLDEAAALILPGRLSARGARLAIDLAPARERASDAALTPEDLREALTELSARFARLTDEAAGALATTWLATWRALRRGQDTSAEALAHFLHLVAHPDRWGSPGRGELSRTGGLARLTFDSELLDIALAALEPKWAADAGPWYELEPLPPRREGEQPFHAADAATLDAVFQEHIPARFGATTAEELRASYRESQREVARQVARNLGGAYRPETRLLLVHAPTGTGKTLAYLIPTLLWARRHEVRVGVATYTRALQEQAMDRELPAALGALRAAGEAGGYRVSMLKGRENYLCWRAFKLHAPGAEGSGEEWMAFATLLAFALTDAEGDLDRLPQRPPLATPFERAHRGALRELRRQARGESSCCRAKDDRATCAAEVARRRAERSHVVITNHSFVLARQDFFKHVVFDECEHLHDQAHAAWSHSVDLASVRGWLERLERGRGRTGGLLRRLEKRLVLGTKSADTLALLREDRDALAKAQAQLAAEVEAFLRWRDQARRERPEADEHALLRDFASSEAGVGLVEARVRFTRLAGGLEARMAEMSERLEETAATRLARLRRALETARADLNEYIEGVDAWLPVNEGQPAFRPRTFHDVEDGARGRIELAARVLLPNEYLGRYYFPSLASAACLSATTWLRGGFEASKAYMGLDRAAEPQLDEERLPCELETFRAPEVFDYSRVLVAVPQDAPPVSPNKDAYLAYAREFIIHLAERTGGRILALFTNAEDVKRVGARLEGHFRARRVPFYFQNMEGRSKEELSELFRRRRDSILLGVDTFWYGADFPGETLEYLVILRLPYGVPDRYHHAQCAALGAAEQRRQIYLPRALAKFRQGFGRLMRKVSDRGCVFLLDRRVLEPRHRIFMGELPVARVGASEEGLARLVRGDTQRCLEQAMVHMGRATPAEPLRIEDAASRIIERFEPDHEAAPSTQAAEVDVDDLPY